MWRYDVLADGCDGLTDKADNQSNVPALYLSHRGIELRDMCHDMRRAALVRAEDERYNLYTVRTTLTQAVSTYWTILRWQRFALRGREPPSPPVLRKVSGGPPFCCGD